jgi:NAD-dependent DNA ligase
LDDLLEMKRRVDERDGTTPETVKAGKVATKWAENLIEGIDRSRKTTLARFLYALGITHVGESTAKALAVWFGEIDLIRHLPWPVLKTIPDIGGEVARAIGHFFAEGNQRVIDAFRARRDDRRCATPSGSRAPPWLRLRCWRNGKPAHCEAQRTAGRSLSSLKPREVRAEQCYAGLRRRDSARLSGKSEGIRCWSVASSGPGRARAPNSASSGGPLTRRLSC